jgi:uncharacterized protein with gpF-like domain
MAIGCQQHIIGQWEAFSDEQIAEMDKNALVWWKLNKEEIFKIIKTALEIKVMKTKKYELISIVETSGYEALQLKVEQYLNNMLSPLSTVVSISINSVDGIAFIVVKKNIGE